MINRLGVLLAAGLVFASVACRKADKVFGGRQGITLVLLDDYKTVDNTMAIAPTSIVLERSTLIAYDDILAYDPESRTFDLSDAAVKAITDLPHSGHSMPFAVLANGEVIYTAYFWASYSSRTCDWLTANPLLISSQHELRIFVGYPAPGRAVIPDDRNDAKILAILRRDQKLK